jgi:hypothetical protein
MTYICTISSSLITSAFNYYIFWLYLPQCITYQDQCLDVRYGTLHLFFSLHIYQCMFKIQLSSLTPLAGAGLLI